MDRYVAGEGYTSVAHLQICTSMARRMKWAAPKLQIYRDTVKHNAGSKPDSESVARHRRRRNPQISKGCESSTLSVRTMFCSGVELSSPTSICVITSWYGVTISISASNAPRRPRKFELRPQARHWRSNKTVAEGDRPSAIVENHSQLEVIAAGLRQLSESLEVTSIHGSARLDFDTD